MLVLKMQQENKESEHEVGESESEGGLRLDATLCIVAAYLSTLKKI